MYLIRNSIYHFFSVELLKIYHIWIQQNQKKLVSIITNPSYNNIEVIKTFNNKLGEYFNMINNCNLPSTDIIDRYYKF